jgi:hypothetical protein
LAREDCLAELLEEADGLVRDNGGLQVEPPHEVVPLSQPQLMLVVQPVDQRAQDLVVRKIVAGAPFENVRGPIESLAKHLIKIFMVQDLLFNFSYF